MPTVKVLPHSERPSEQVDHIFVGETIAEAMSQLLVHPGGGIARVAGSVTPEQHNMMATALNIARRCLTSHTWEIYTVKSGPEAGVYVVATPTGK